MRIDREQMTIDALNVVKRLLTKRGTLVIERKNPFRHPTKKELVRHPKLLSKQRRKSTGEQ